jgi:competence protein ComEC
MIILSPFSLNYDVSLHLSFLAVLGIIYTQKFFDNLFNFLPNFLEIKTAFVLTLSALVFTLPIMIFNFGQVSILAPFANIAVTWTIPIAMLFGFISILVHFVSPL